MNGSLHVTRLQNRERFTLAGEVSFVCRIAFGLRDEALVQRKFGVDVGRPERRFHRGVLIVVIGSLFVVRDRDDFLRIRCVNVCSVLAAYGRDLIRRGLHVAVAAIDAVAGFTVAGVVLVVGVLTGMRGLYCGLEHRSYIRVRHIRRFLEFLRDEKKPGPKNHLGKMVKCAETRRQRNGLLSYPICPLKL